MKEYFDVVDEKDKVIGRASRAECHSNPKLIHRGILVVIANKKGEILLQKRSMKKDLYGGLWAISVGGHNDIGESYEAAAKREMKEELGLDLPLRKLGKILIKQKMETEFDMTFEAKISNNKIRLNKEEINRVKFFTVDEIRKLKSGETVPDVSEIIDFYLKHK